MQLIKGKIILFALIVGLVYILPHILFIFEYDRNYHLFFNNYEENLFYVARAREKYDGNYLSSDPYIYENKTRPYARPFLSEYLVGILGKILGLSIDSLFLMGDFVFPIIIFYLLFYFLNLFVRSPSLSLMGSVVVLLAEFPDSLKALLKLNFPNNTLIFSRYINPQFQYIFFVACLIFIYKSLVNGRVIDFLFSGLFLGLLFYMFLYFWIYILVGLFVLSLYLVFKGKFKQIKTILFIFTEALFISIPFWINYLRLTSLPFYNEMMTRIGLQTSRHIIILKLPILILITFIFFYKKRDFNFYFLLAFLLGGLLCMNQQVLTGWTILPDYLYSNVYRQMIIMAGIVLLDRFLEESKFRERFIRFFLITSFTFSISIGIITQVYNYEKNRHIQFQQQNLYDAFVWLQDNTKKEDVVLASDRTASLIPIYTHNNVYWSNYIFDYANSDKDILERFFLLSRLLGINEDRVMDYIFTYRKEEDSNVFFGVRYEKQSYQNFNQGIKINLPQDVYDYIKQRYRAFQKEDINMLLNRFRLDYIFYGPDEKLISRGRFKEQSFLDKVYDAGSIQIYKIIR